MKKVISIRFDPKTLDLPSLGGGDTDLLVEKLKKRWPELMREVQAEKLARKGTAPPAVPEAHGQGDDQDDQDGPFVDVDDGPDFVESNPDDGADGRDDGDGQDGDGQDGDGQDGDGPGDGGNELPRLSP